MPVLRCGDSLTRGYSDQRGHDSEYNQCASAPRRHFRHDAPPFGLLLSCARTTRAEMAVAAGRAEPPTVIGAILARNLAGWGRTARVPTDSQAELQFALAETLCFRPSNQFKTTLICVTCGGFASIIRKRPSGDTS